VPGQSGATTGPAGVIRVLQQFTCCPEDGLWVTQQLSEGAQASIFSVRRHDGQPVWQANYELIVKLYKPVAWQEVGLVRGQFESLARLHARLHDCHCNGWKICVPAPLYQGEDPLAVVMTVVPGQSLNCCLERPGRLPPELLGTIAETVVVAMQRCWCAAQIHGDLNFDNILCDVAARSLSFVDPGVIEDDFLCESVSRRWFPASRDLAYLLYDTGVTVKRTFANPGARQRQQTLSELVLRAFLKKIDPDEKHGLLDEVQACARVHLKRLRASWSLRGVWHLFLRRIAAYRIDQILGRLRASGRTSQ
jgi:hypothetical protein